MTVRTAVRWLSEPDIPGSMNTGHVVPGSVSRSTSGVMVTVSASRSLLISATTAPGAGATVGSTSSPAPRAAARDDR